MFKKFMEWLTEEPKPSKPRAEPTPQQFWTPTGSARGLEARERWRQGVEHAEEQQDEK